MDSVFMLFVGLLCLMLGVRVFCDEEQTKVFNRRNLPLTDVKKYNHLCGTLIIGFGIVADITIFFLAASESILSSFITVAMIIEAVIVVLLYGQIEKKMIRKR